VLGDILLFRAVQIVENVTRRVPCEEGTSVLSVCVNVHLKNSRSDVRLVHLITFLDLDLFCAVDNLFAVLFCTVQSAAQGPTQLTLCALCQQ
jgi:hypothetical protein